MPSLLKDFIIKQIEQNGPMSVGAFMSIALGHPEHGYYMKQDPFGRSGDFTTAPEVSQMFGEMLGAWAADIWMQLGSPSKFAFVECGPGRGTLMADMMRATKGVEGFREAAQVHLLEISPVLKAKQAEALEGCEPRWHESLDSVPEDVPLIVIANEFLDALPFQQHIDGQERMVILNEEGDLAFSADGEIVESSKEREDFVRALAGLLRAQNGAALFIDYGPAKSGVGDTFQAIKGHEYVDVLADIGDVDLTSHVDFEALLNAVDIQRFGPAEQGAFLQRLGISLRAQMLKENSDSEQCMKIEKDLHRLVASDQMGALFKVIGLCHAHNAKLTPAGF